MKGEFYRQIFEKIFKCQISLKILSVEAEALHANGQTWGS